MILETIDVGLCVFEYRSVFSLGMWGGTREGRLEADA